VSDQADIAAWQMLLTMMQAFPGSFPPEKIAQLQQAYAEALKSEAGEIGKVIIDEDLPATAFAKDLEGLSLADAFVKCCQAISAKTLTVRQMFMALFLAAFNTPTPFSFQDQTDKALHFICGGVIEALGGSGDLAGRVKEWHDSLGYGDFDPNDYAATSMGSAWVDYASRDASAHWLEQWSGQASLDRSTPPLSYVATEEERTNGQFSPETIARIAADIKAAYDPIFG